MVTLARAGMALNEAQAERLIELIVDHPSQAWRRTRPAGGCWRPWSAHAAMAFGREKLRARTGRSRRSSRRQIEELHDTTRRMSVPYAMAISIQMPVAVRPARAGRTRPEHSTGWSRQYASSSGSPAPDACHHTAAANVRTMSAIPASHSCQSIGPDVWLTAQPP